MKTLTGGAFSSRGGGRSLRYLMLLIAMAVQAASPARPPQTDLVAAAPARTEQLVCLAVVARPLRGVRRRPRPATVRSRRHRPQLMPRSGGGGGGGNAMASKVV